MRPGIPGAQPVVIRGFLSGVALGDHLEPVVMGAINVGPSFYGGSVAADRDGLLRTGERMAAAGAALLDVGARSTAPYLETVMSEAEEADRLGEAVGTLTAKLGVPVSADTSLAGPARAALEAGATVINDVSGLDGDAALAPLVARAGADLIAMVSERGDGDAALPGATPVDAVARLLAASLARAAAAGIAAERVTLDPGIGFFRRQRWPWPDWDCLVLARLGELRALGRPLCVGASRKSFIGAVAGAPDPAERLPGSLAAATAAVLGGAHLIRAHDVAETVQAVRVAHALRRARERDEREPRESGAGP